MPNNFVKWLDAQLWRPIKDFTNAHAAWVSICSDKRSDCSRNPFIYQLASAAILNRWNIITKWMGFAVNPWLGGTFGAGASSEFAPSRALEGAIWVWCTTTKIVTTTVMTAVWVNMLANRWGSGDLWYKVRIIGKSVGKVEERFIVWNTWGTTPTLSLDAPLTFTPTAADTYEILWWRVFMLNAWVIAATSFRSLEVASNLLANEWTAWLPTPATDSYITALDEQYTPSYAEPGSWMVLGAFMYDDGTYTDRFALAATAAWASSLTWQATLWDATLLANEYRNFQIRIVQDLTNPTAVGQRRMIASHTAWPSVVYTLGSAWTVAPSASAKFVIEYPNLLILRTNASNVVYVYNYNKETVANGTNTITAATWHTTFFGIASGVCWAWVTLAPSFWITPDPDKNARHSFVYHLRWGNTTTIDLLDIAWGTAGAWSAAIVYDGWIAMTTWTCGDYAPCDNEWRFHYLNIYWASVHNQIHRFDVQNRVLSPYTPTNNLQSGTAAVWNRIATYAILKSDTEKYSWVFLLSHLSTNAQEIITQI